MKIVKANGTYGFYNKVEILDRLPVGYYNLEFDAKGNIFLVDTDPIRTPEKLYDVDKDFRKMVIKSFSHNSGNTGVLLEGYKGQGKSVCAALLCKEIHLPIIMITRAIPQGINIASFIQDIHQEFVLYVDEFEKLFPSYNPNNDQNPTTTQDVFLTLTDGAMNNDHRKLFLFTSNDEINDKFMNRPSRIRFHKKYEVIPEELYNNIIDDLLINKDFRDDLIANLGLNEATVDMLISIINEVNLQERPYSEFMRVFNHTPKRVRCTLFWKNGRHWNEIGKVHVKGGIGRSLRQVDNIYISELIELTEDEMHFRSGHVHNKLFNKVDTANYPEGIEYKLELAPTVVYETVM